MDIRLTPSELSGRITAISSKSDAHRLLIASALSDCETVIFCNSSSEDIKATIGALNSLGANIVASNGKITVKPIKKAAKKACLNCGESGSTLRFLLPVAGALGVNATFDGSGRLPQRPIAPLRREMESFGVTFTPPWQFPITISGQLESGDYTLQGNISSQFVTGLLFALPLLKGDSTIRLIPPVESLSYIKMTLNTLKKFGIEIEFKRNKFNIKGNQKYISPKEVTAEGDWSNAAFFLVAGAFSKKGITVSGLDKNSVQGDRAVTDILKKAGASVRWYGNAVTVREKSLNSFSVDASDIPDLVPVLSVAAVGAKSGVSTFTHAERLRIKECDRLAAVCECLNNIGTVVAETDDGMVIWGGENIKGGNVFSFNDHRIVMSMSTASVLSKGEIIIRDAEAVNKSYPNFFEDFNKLGGKADVINNQGE